MSRVLSDINKLNTQATAVLGEFFPQAPVEVRVEPYLSHFFVGAIGPLAQARVVCISIAHSVADMEYKRRIETIRNAARLSQEKLLTGLKTNSLKQLTFVPVDVAKAVYNAQPKEKKS